LGANENDDIEKKREKHTHRKRDTHTQQEVDKKNSLDGWMSLEERGRAESSQRAELLLFFRKKVK
jgi:hypothetical protein